MAEQGRDSRARSVDFAELAEGLEAIQSGLVVLQSQVKAGRIHQSYEYDLFALYVQLVNLRERLVADAMSKTILAVRDSEEAESTTI